MTDQLSEARVGKRTVVGISQMMVSDVGGEILITYSLGSCVGVSVYDPKLGIGGLIHCMLPLSKIEPAKARQDPATFVDTGIPHLLNAMLTLGASKGRLLVKLAGASSSLGSGDRFRIGERNVTVLRKILWKNDLMLAAEDVGGTAPRTMMLDIGTGVTTLRTGKEEREL